jgi:hypothetical protein
VAQFTPKRTLAPQLRLDVTGLGCRNRSDGCGVHVASVQPGVDEFSVRRIAEYGYNPKLAVDSTGRVHQAFCTSEGLVYAVESD